MSFKPSFKLNPYSNSQQEAVAEIKNSINLLGNEKNNGKFS